MICPVILSTVKLFFLSITRKHMKFCSFRWNFGRVGAARFMMIAILLLALCFIFAILGSWINQWVVWPVFFLYWIHIVDKKFMVSMKVHVYTDSISTGKLLYIKGLSWMTWNVVHIKMKYILIHSFVKSFIFFSFVNEVKLSWTSQTNFLLKIPSATITYYI